MASNQESIHGTKFPFQVQEMERQMNLEPQKKEFDYSKRSQWLRAAVLGANDGLVSTASLMMGVGAVKEDIKAMIITGFAGLVAGACSMAIGEFVSVYSQLDIEVAQMKREKRREDAFEAPKVEVQEEENDESLPSPVQAAAASALAFSLGAMVPLLAASFIKAYRVRIGVVVAAVTLALMVFGWLGAVLGRAPVVRTAARVLIGGWLAMAITFGLTKLIGIKGL
ncbi:vacuolar iron transporter homolog 4-like [Olea europaea subsp. europaea]|uniref:Vacuolar iron transporter n=1 Tax=Olea europaea subsp. europaea TaxID=158383 RepID=A0A8S0VI75_OLEEU|nr:vacuolar iron transporter homolog 4-like [Olea europaea subsp. europaea]